MTKQEIIETIAKYTEIDEGDIGVDYYINDFGIDEIADTLLAKFEQEKKKAIEDVFYDINSDELRDNYWDYLDMQDKSVVSVEQMKIAAKIEAYEEVFEALKNLAKEYGVEL